MVNVRDSAFGDMPGLMRIERESFSTPWSEGAVRSFLLDPERRACFSAEDGARGAVIGYLALQFVGDEAEICNLAVSPAERGRGAGALLVDTAVDFCARRSIRILHLEVREKNTPAIALYRKKGFLPVGVRRGYYADSGEDALLFSRMIREEPITEPGGNPLMSD